MVLSIHDVRAMLKPSSVQLEGRTFTSSRGTALRVMKNGVRAAPPVQSIKTAASWHCKSRLKLDGIAVPASLLNTGCRSGGSGQPRRMPRYISQSTKSEAGHRRRRPSTARGYGPARRKKTAPKHRFFPTWDVPSGITAQSQRKFLQRLDPRRFGARTPILQLVQQLISAAVRAVPQGAQLSAHFMHRL